eukprot:tig00000551_g2031.t1
MARLVEPAARAFVSDVVRRRCSALKLCDGEDCELDLAVIGRSSPGLAGWSYLNCYLKRTIRCPVHSTKLLHFSLQASGEVILKCTESTRRHCLFADRFNEDEVLLASILFEFGSLEDVTLETLLGEEAADSVASVSPAPLPAEAGRGAAGARGAFACLESDDAVSICSSSLAPTPLSTTSSCVSAFDFPTPRGDAPSPSSPLQRTASAAACAALPPASPALSIPLDELLCPTPDVSGRPSKRLRSGETPAPASASLSRHLELSPPSPFVTAPLFDREADPFTVLPFELSF